MATTATKESRSAGGTDAVATTEPKNSSESFNKHDSTSKGDSSSEAGSPLWIHDSSVDSDGSGGGQSVGISSACDNIGVTDMSSPDSGESSDGQKSDLSGKTTALCNLLLSW